MPDTYNTMEAKLAEHVSLRVAGLCQVIRNDVRRCQIAESLPDLPEIAANPAASNFLDDWANSADYETGKAVALALDEQRSLVVVNASPVCNVDASLIAVIQGAPIPAQCLLDAVLEGYQLATELQSSQAALEESAMQLAQSFEEQNWLRGFARNATTLSKACSANDMAVGILRPLGYLLRAQDVYLLVDPQETERSGLSCAKYGESDYSIETIRKLVSDQGIGANNEPVVRNNLSISTDDGPIRSLIVVSLVGHAKCFGRLVGINKSSEVHRDGLPFVDPEFGSCEVGLLEEAAVLLSTQAHNIHLLVQSNEMFLGSLHAMSNAIDARDPYTQGHSQRVARLSFELAKLLGLSNEACQEIYLAGILHDIGKIGIPDSVLLKAGGLTDDEFRVIQQHPEIGYRIVERLGQLQCVLPGILHHHERWDGQGYPHGLAGESIPLMARVLSVADAFDAMTSSRTYRKAMPLAKARSIIHEGRHTQWDAGVVEQFDGWVQQRTREQNSATAPGASLILEDSPVESILQAVMVLGL